MPRATSEKFSRAHEPSAKKKDNQASGSMTNPIFNTARFGQHILKNPATAQKLVLSYLVSFMMLILIFRIVDAVSFRFNVVEGFVNDSKIGQFKTDR